MRSFSCLSDWTHVNWTFFQNLDYCPRTKAKCSNILTSMTCVSISLYMKLLCFVVHCTSLLFSKSALTFRCCFVCLNSLFFVPRLSIIWFPISLWRGKVLLQRRRWNCSCKCLWKIESGSRAVHFWKLSKLCNFEKQYHLWTPDYCSSSKISPNSGAYTFRP